MNVSDARKNAARWQALRPKESQNGEGVPVDALSLLLAGASRNYFPQAQLSHSQTSQVQISPSQPGHEQTVEASSPVDSHSAFEQHDVSQHPLDVSAFTALLHPQLPHLQTSQVQNSPLQSGHAQSTQPQLAALVVPCAVAKLHAMPMAATKPMLITR